MHFFSFPFRPFSFFSPSYLIFSPSSLPPLPPLFSTTNGHTPVWSFNNKCYLDNARVNLNTTSSKNDHCPMSIDIPHGSDYLSKFDISTFLNLLTEKTNSVEPSLLHTREGHLKITSRYPLSGKSVFN